MDGLVWLGVDCQDVDLTSLPMRVVGMTLHIKEKQNATAVRNFSVYRKVVAMKSEKKAGDRP
jgi:hypothetical protein